MHTLQRIPRSFARRSLTRVLSTSANVVPAIDLGPARLEGEEGKQSVAKQIADACEHTGFMSIVNHGIPQQVIDGIWQSTREFYDLPEEEKVASAKMTEEYPVRRRWRRARRRPLTVAANAVRICPRRRRGAGAGQGRGTRRRHAARCRPQGVLQRRTLQPGRR